MRDFIIDEILIYEIDYMLNFGINIQELYKYVVIMIKINKLTDPASK